VRRHPEARSIDTIIFDCEGVVIDTETLWDQAQEELLARRGVPYDRSRLKPLLTGRSSLEGAETIVSELGLPDDPRQLALERLTIVRRSIGEKVGFIPGFQDFFARARRRFKTAMATAMDEDLFELADRKLQLYGLFEGRVVTLSDVDHRSKPNPDLFLEAARRTRSQPATCAVIEDAPHGIEAARRAGMGSIGLATTYDPGLLAGAAPDVVVRSFDELSFDALADLRSSAATGEPARTKVGVA
jgi:HAD superfamily hydrolase (TIGR01509 family)